MPEIEISPLVGCRYFWEMKFDPAQEGDEIILKLSCSDDFPDDCEIKTSLYELPKIVAWITDGLEELRSRKNEFS